MAITAISSPVVNNLNPVTPSASPDNTVTAPQGPSDRASISGDDNQPSSSGESLLSSIGQGAYDFLVGDGIKNFKDAGNDIAQGNYGSALWNSAKGVFNLAPQGKLAKLGGKLAAKIGGKSVTRALDKLQDGWDRLAGGPQPALAGGPRGANINRMDWQPGQGVPRPRHIGPSGKPKVHNTQGSRKRMKDGARNSGSGTPVHHPDGGKGSHFHPTKHRAQTPKGKAGKRSLAGAKKPSAQGAHFKHTKGKPSKD